MRTHPARIEDWLQLIRAEFDEPFGLRLTAGEAADRWAPLDRMRLSAILEALTDSGYLRRATDGTYFRRVDDEPETSGSHRVPRHSPPTVTRPH